MITIMTLDFILSKENQLIFSGKKLVQTKTLPFATLAKPP